MKDTFNASIGYLCKYHGIKSKEKCHRVFSNLVLKGKLREAIRFICAREIVFFFQPNELEEDLTGIMNETVTLVLVGKHPHKKFPSCVTL